MGDILFHFGKAVWVRVGLHVLYFDSRTNGYDITAIFVGAAVVVHLALQIASCIVSTSAQSGSTHSSCIPIQVDEQGERNILFEAMLLGWFPIARTNDRPV